MVEHNPLVSVIVPVYKAEKYMHECIDSILGQTLQDIEVLLIDDGSPDESGRICDAYAEKDCRVRVFHKENGGVSSARQCGLDNARGKYLIHADPDDWTETDMLEALYRKAEEEEADMVICDFFWESGKSSTVCRQQPPSLDSDSVLMSLFQGIHGSCWNKLVRTDVFMKYGVGFNDGLSFCEDLMINARLLKNPLKVAYLDRPFYHYVQHVNQNSISRSYSQSVYEYDKALTEALIEVVKGTKAEQAADVYMRTMAVQRAFFSGYFTSSEFKERFHDSRHHVGKARHFGAVTRAVFYLSCMGLYRPIYRVMDFVRKYRSR